MRLIPLTLTLALAIVTPVAAFAASATTVRAIAFVASNDRGATDPRLAPYEATLRSNLRFESYRYVGETSASVNVGATANLSVPGGGQLRLHSDSTGSVEVRRGGTVVTISPGHPAVFMSGPAGKGGVSGVIVMTL